LSPARADVTTPSLTFESIRARPVLLKLQRPIVARIATITEWPLILIDLTTCEGIVGRAYLEPYTARTMRYLVQALHDLGDVLKGPPGCAGRALYGCPEVAAFRRLSRPVGDCGVGHRHGRVGCAGEGCRRSAVRAARRVHR
jgi:hypothetical protein